jgi:hypothetical protein
MIRTMSVTLSICGDIKNNNNTSQISTDSDPVIDLHSRWMQACRIVVLGVTAIIASTKIKYIYIPCDLLPDLLGRIIVCILLRMKRHGEVVRLF